MSVVCILVEGTLDEAVAREVIAASGGRPGTVFPKKGFDYIANRIQDFNQTAQGIPILTLVDLMDTDFDCPVEAVQEWLPHQHQQMLLRFVVKEIESWILADRMHVARMLGVRKAKVPYHPEDLSDPKAALVDLARSSPYDGLRNAVVPDDPTVKAQGPGYNSRFERFVHEKWSPEEAQKNAPSLRRCIRAVESLLEKQQ